MNSLFFENALLPEGWSKNVLIELDDAGLVTCVTAGSSTPLSGSDGKIAVAGMANLHSHAFQRAMAGLGEWAGDHRNDSFWSWREVMYRFVERLRPEDLQAVASQLYIEMLEAGFTAVGEFHYLHHLPDGSSYDILSEMSDQVMTASRETGIALTLLPVFYAHGGFGGEPVQSSQHRFYNDSERFLRLVEECRQKVKGRESVGIAPHSLRAVTPEALKEVVSECSEEPIHIHIAEQVKEVEDCLSWSGARPVEWLQHHFDVNERWCLVHATHLNEDETKRLATSQAVAGLCPITEANLGDGIFAGTLFHEHKGRWGIGSDSHIRIDLAEELRSYEYSQRLRDLARNRLADPKQATGLALFDGALKGGAQALAQPMGAIRTGNYCDMVSLDNEHPVLLGREGDDWLNSWIFAGDKSCVKDVWVSGKHVVKQGRHQHKEKAAKAFAATMDYLVA